MMTEDQRREIMNPHVASDLSRRAAPVCYSPRAYLALGIDLLLDMREQDYTELGPDEVAQRLAPYIYPEVQGNPSYEPFGPACRAARMMPVMELCSDGHVHDLYAPIFGGGPKYCRRPLWAEEVSGFGVQITALTRAWKRARHLLMNGFCD